MIAGIMMVKRYVENIGSVMAASLLLLMGIVSGCSDSESDNPIDGSGFEVKVPVTFNIHSEGELITKSGVGNDENSGTHYDKVRDIFVDEVKLYVFKRETGNYNDKVSNFQLDETMSQTLTCQRFDKYPFWRASGSINLSSGWEYRINAIAYSKKNNENDLFKSDGKLMEYFNWYLNKGPEYKCPEFFYGNLTHGIDTLLTIEKVGSNGNLEGWLRRGVAGIEVKLGNVNGQQNADSRVHKVELLADSVNTRVKGRSYADFKSPYDMKKNGTYSHFLLAVDSLKDGQANFDNDSIRLVYANLLPVCSSLSLRITKKDKQGKETKLYCSLRVREGKGGTTTKTIPGSGSEEQGNGTGIIPGIPEVPDKPENPEEQINPFRICFQRNHYYRIKGDFSKLLLNEYILQVTVNPNWDGDIYLPLDKS